MSSLLVRRPPGWRMHEDDEAQGSLFGGEALLPPARRPRELDSRMPRSRPNAIEAAAADVIAPFEDGVDAGSAHVRRAPLAGPTLDDAISRAWEGLGAGVPAACPVCHAEIAPALGGSLQGHCGSCHVTLD